MYFKGTKKTLPEIARELNVDAVVEGSVLRSGNRVRVTANLLHAPTDRQLWANSYESELQDVLVLQGEMVRAIAEEVRIELTPDEQVRLAPTRPFNPEAYKAYLMGRHFWNKRSAFSFIQDPSLTNGGGDKGKGNGAPLSDFFGRIDQDVYRHVEPRQSHIKRGVATVPRLVGLLDHEDVKITLGPAAAPRSAAKQYNFLRLRGLNNAADNVSDYILAHKRRAVSFRADYPIGCRSAAWECSLWDCTMCPRHALRDRRDLGLHKTLSLPLAFWQTVGLQHGPHSKFPKEVLIPWVKNHSHGVNSCA